MEYEFLKNITKNINFSGNTDFNNAIKTYVGRVFRYKIDDDIIETFLFDNIPYNKGTETNFKRLWKCYSNYSTYQSTDPFIYKKI